MPFRERVKRAFGRSSSNSDLSSPSDLSTVSKVSSRKSKKAKDSVVYPDNVYKPGEPMPRPKYRGPVNKQHQAKLHSFTFAGALDGIRRRSIGSQQSPMGSRFPSRQGSKTSGIFGGPSRPASIVGAVEENQDGDDDTGNVGLSRHHTHESQRPKSAIGQSQKDSLTGQNTAMDRHVNRKSFNKPFTEVELAHALTKTTLKPIASEA